MKPIGPQAMERLLGSLNTSVLLLDDALFLRYLNPAAEILLEESERHTVGLGLAQFLPNNSLLLERVRDARDRNHPFSDREMPLILPNGRRRVVCCMVSPVAASGGGVEMVIEMVPVDRHLRIVREEQLLAQNNTTRSLIRGIAHEVKNPLGGLRGAAQLLELEIEDPELKEYTRIIMGEADRLRTLLDRMLGPSLPTEMGEVNVHQGLVRVQQLVEAEVPAGVRVDVDYDPSLPTVHWNLDQLIQVLLNLVRNAVRAVGDSGRILLRTRSFRHFSVGDVCHRLVLRIEVIDDGPGVPDDIVDSIFLPMVTGHPEGSGLGLSIAQTLVQRAGGLIECISEPGKTNFSIYLPVANGSSKG